VAFVEWRSSAIPRPNKNHGLNDVAVKEAKQSFSLS
jgi:hypothetical protein